MPIKSPDGLRKKLYEARMRIKARDERTKTTKERYYREFATKMALRRKIEASKKVSEVEEMQFIQLTPKKLADLTNLDAQIGVRQLKKTDEWCVVIRIPLGSDKSDADDVFKELLK